MSYIYTFGEMQETFPDVRIEMGPRMAFFVENGINKVYITWMLGWRGLEIKPEGYAVDVIFTNKEKAIEAFKWSLRNILHNKTRCVIRALPSIQPHEYIDSWDDLPHTKYVGIARFYLE